LITARAARHALDAVNVAFFDTHLRQIQTASIPKVLAAHRDLVVLGTQPFR
jgi:hypothetical protein